MSCDIGQDYIACSTSKSVSNIKSCSGHLAIDRRGFLSDLVGAVSFCCLFFFTAPFAFVCSSRLHHLFISRSSELCGSGCLGGVSNHNQPIKSQTIM